MKITLWEYSSAGSERLPYKQEVTGSIPVTPTFYICMKKFVPFLLSLLLATACVDHSAPKGVMDEPTMAQFLSEAYMLEAYYAIECGYDFEQMEPQIAKSYKSLLDKYNLSEGDFEKSIAYYFEHDDVYARILDSATALIEQHSAQPTRQ